MIGKVVIGLIIIYYTKKIHQKKYAYKKVKSQNIIKEKE
jgi:hypothetical protein